MFLMACATVRVAEAVATAKAGASPELQPWKCLQQRDAEQVRASVSPGLGTGEAKSFSSRRARRQHALCQSSSRGYPWQLTPVTVPSLLMQAGSYVRRGTSAEWQDIDPPHTPQAAPHISTR